MRWLWSIGFLLLWLLAAIYDWFVSRYTWWRYGYRLTNQIKYSRLEFRDAAAERAYYRVRLSTWDINPDYTKEDVERELGYTSWKRD